MRPGSTGVPAGGLIEGILQRGEPETVAPEDGTSELLTFLFADIRGYTSFTQQRGDAAAADLVARFARIVRDLVGRIGGAVLELRGDEVLCVFASPRQALRVAVALQQRFVEETVADSGYPLPVGVGIDVGEAVRVHDGYRGSALNLAARLCARAKPGEVLASTSVTHLAGTIDGVHYVLGAKVSLKGFSEPVRPVRVLPAGADPATTMAELLTARAAAAGPMRWLPGPLARRPGWTAAGAVVVTILVAATIVAVTSHDPAGRHLTALSENSLGVLDPHTRTIESEVPVEIGPIAAAAGMGAVWTANSVSGSVSRVEVGSHQVRTIAVGSAPSAIAVGMNSVWVTNSADGTVSRIDPATNQAHGIAVGSSPGGVVVAHGSVWVTNTADGTVSRIDPATNEVVETIAVGGSPSGIAAGADIWVANSSSNTVTKIDATTHRPAAPIAVGHDPKGVAVIGDTVWVTNNLDDNVTRIAASGTSSVDTVHVGVEPTQIATVDGHVWIASQATGSIAEIDPALPLVVRTVAVGPVTGGIVAVNGKLWVATTIDPARHRGGTLRIIGDDVGSLDPSYIQDNFFHMFDLTYDGLVAFRHAAGSDGTTIVPDLATDIPDPIGGGRTYVFHLRPGIRWSTGGPVTVADVQRGLERSIASGETALAAQIQGGSTCRPARCVVPGIAVDAAAGTVTITLVRPDGNFIDDLTASVAVPASTPLRQQGSLPFPTTGPYRIARYAPHRFARFTRNPYFREWSPAAQPAGYPDAIDWRINAATKDKHRVDEVAAQRVDYADARSAAPLGSLQARFSGRLWVSPTQSIHGVALNTRVAPFDDVRVRRALAYAVDRGAVAKAWFTPAAVTCQIVAPGLPAHRPYCPYTLQRNDEGTWIAPDFP
ncbi:MAG: ABC transporter substrate-binding protein, partial [Jatrophihabitantaceae bacterium]